MELRITGLDNATHAAAKFLSARTGVTLQRFIAEAIHAHCLRTAHAQGLTGDVLKKIDPKNTKPARS